MAIAWNRNRNQPPGCYIMTMIIGHESDFDDGNQEPLDDALDRVTYVTWTIARAKRTFLHMPLMHSERLVVQSRCIALFQEMASELTGAAKEAVEFNVAFAIKHRDIIERFGRFPQRNQVIGRQVATPKWSFSSSQAAPSDVDLSDITKKKPPHQCDGEAFMRRAVSQAPD